MTMAVLALAGCDRAPPTPAEQNAANPLEAAARARGLVADQQGDLTGVFERRHELGRDAMCAVPDGEDEWRFAMTASFGAGLSCRATGTAVREGEGWRLRFAGAPGCEALVEERDDELRLPGRLPSQCASLCPARAGLDGLRLPRASWSERDARSLIWRSGSGAVEPCR